MMSRSIIIRGGAVRCAIVLDGVGRVLGHGYGRTKGAAIARAIAAVEADAAAAAAPSFEECDACGWIAPVWIAGSELLCHGCLELEATKAARGGDEDRHHVYASAAVAS